MRFLPILITALSTASFVQARPFFPRITKLIGTVTGILSGTVTQPPVDPPVGPVACTIIGDKDVNSWSCPGNPLCTTKDTYKPGTVIEFQCKLKGYGGTDPAPSEKTEPPHDWVRLKGFTYLALVHIDPKADCYKKYKDNEVCPEQ